MRWSKCLYLLVSSFFATSVFADTLTPRQQAFGRAFPDGYTNATIARLDRLITTKFTRLAAKYKSCGLRCQKQYDREESGLRKQLARYRKVVATIRVAEARVRGVRVASINLSDGQTGKPFMTVQPFAQVSVDVHAIPSGELTIEPVFFDGNDPEELVFYIDGNEVKPAENRAPWFITGDPKTRGYVPLHLSAGQHEITMKPRHANHTIMGLATHMVVTLNDSLPATPKIDPHDNPGNGGGNGGGDDSSMCGAAPVRADKMDGHENWQVISGGGTHLHGYIKNKILKGGGVATNANDEAAFIIDSGTTLENVIVTGTRGVGLAFGGPNSAEGVTLINVVAYGNGAAGIGGKARYTTDSNGNIKYSLICHSKTFKNNSLGLHSAGGGKFTRSVGLWIEDYEAYDNNGPGVWFDNYNYGIVVTNSSFHDNHSKAGQYGGRGLAFEISGRRPEGAFGSACFNDKAWTSKKCGTLRAEKNTFYGNAETGLLAYASSNVQIINNTFKGDNLNFKDGGRDTFVLRDVWADQNHFSGGGSIIADADTAKNCSSENFNITNSTFDGGGKGWSCSRPQ